MSGATIDLLEQCETELEAERGSRVLTLLEGLGERAQLSDREWTRATVLGLHARAYPDAHRRPEAVDRLILIARAALDGVTDPTSRALLLREAAFHLSLKRCDGLAQKAARAAIDADPGNSAGHEALALVHLQFDRRDEARAILEPAVHLVDGWRAHLALARVAYVTGEFDRTLAELEIVQGHPHTAVHIARWQAAVAQVRGAWEAHLRALDAILARTEGGYRHRGDQLRRASTLVKLDRRDEARACYRDIWKADETDGAGRFAREVLTTFERGGEGEHVHLPAFPTVTQKRNYCGPATVELVLRHLGVDTAGQDAIAAQVKLKTGSPMIRLTRYLEGQGLTVRRFESSPARLRECLRLGLPVILQEEYSITTHVVVLTGLDEQVGILTVQDPMTHVPSERLIATQSNLGALFRNGALVAYQTVRADVGAALDRADVVDAAHIRLLDSCDDGTLGDADEAAGTPSPEEVIRRCREALALCDDYLLARLRLTSELLYTAQRHPSDGNMGRFLTALRELRVRYGGEERPHQIHAQYLLFQRRYDEALIEYEDALRLDPDDSNNAQYIAECHQQLQHSKEATAAFWHALTLDPEHIRATENFAAHALDLGDVDLAEHLAACALDLAPNNPFNHMTASLVALKRGHHEEAVGYARRAVEIDPAWAGAQTHLADVLTRAEATRPEAIEILLKLSQRYPKWFRPRLDAARWMRDAGQVDDAVALLVDGVECADDDAADLLGDAIDALVHDGRTGEAIELAEKYADERSSTAMQRRRASLLESLGRTDEALAIVSKLVEVYPNDASLLEGLASVHLARCEIAAAETALRKAIDLAPTFRWARNLLVARVLRDRPEQALALVDAEAVGTDTALGTLRAELQWTLGQKEAARATLEAVVEQTPHTETSAHVLYTRMALAGDAPDIAAARWSRDGSPALARRRVALALDLARGHHAEAREVLATIPIDDWITVEMLCSAVEVDDTLRDDLEGRVRARMAHDVTKGATRSRYDAALLAGSAAARGDRAALERLFAEGRTVAQIRDAVRTLDDVRHAALIDEIRSVAITRAPGSRMADTLEANRLAARGDHAALEAFVEEALARHPHEPALLEYRAWGLAWKLDPRAGKAADRMLDAGTAWAYGDALVGALAWVAGERDKARTAILRAFETAVAHGWSLQVHPLLVALLAVTRGDRERAAALRTHAGLFQNADGALWTKLLAPT